MFVKIKHSIRKATVISLEQLCSLTHWATHHNPLVNFVPICYLASLSFKLDEKWGTDVFQKGDEDTDDSIHL